MGRDWRWTGRLSKKSGGSSNGGGGGRDAARGDREASTSSNSSGCMSAVLHLFDFQQLHLQVQHPRQSFKPSSFTNHQDHLLVPIGAEAPRNSLESEDYFAMVSVSNTEAEEHNLKFPVKDKRAGIQIKTKFSTRATAGNQITDESNCDSPGTKTPTLVARLMGLDLLPEAQSPSSSSSTSTALNPQRVKPQTQSQSHAQPQRRNGQHGLTLTKPRNSTDSDVTSCRSMPETPRISLARRSDVDHRLSLQINKENHNVSLRDEFVISRISFSREKFEEQGTRSSGHYARQIVKQVKESVGRRVGLDITNTVKNREVRRDEILLNHLKSKKSSNSNLKTSSGLDLADDCSPGKQSSNSRSPRLKFIETKNRNRASSSSSSSSSPATPKDQNFNSHAVKKQSFKVLAMPKAQVLQQQQKKVQNQAVLVRSKKAAATASEKFSISRLKKPPQTTDVIRNKREESFVVRPLSTTRTNMPDLKNKCKKSNPLSSNLVLNHPTPLPVKKHPSPPATKIIQKQSLASSLRVSDTEESADEHCSQLSNSSSQANKQEHTQKPRTTTTTTTRETQNDDVSDRLNIAGAQQHNCCSRRTSAAELQYVRDILNRTDIQRGTELCFNNWFSPSHPLDPSIFLCLEERSATSISSGNNTNNPLDLRCNRKLLFDVVDEVLGEILKPCIMVKKYWRTTCFTVQSQMQGLKLLEILCKKILSFPMLNCQFLEDIDELINLALSELGEDVMAIEQEGEGLVAEIECDILDTLVHETVCGCAADGTTSFHHQLEVRPTTSHDHDP